MHELPTHFLRRAWSSIPDVEQIWGLCIYINPITFQIVLICQCWESNQQSSHLAASFWQQKKQFVLFGNALTDVRYWNIPQLIQTFQERKSSILMCHDENVFFGIICWPVEAFMCWGQKFTPCFLRNTSTQNISGCRLLERHLSVNTDYIEC